MNTHIMVDSRRAILSFLIDLAIKTLLMSAKQEVRIFRTGLRAMGSRVGQLVRMTLTKTLLIYCLS